MMLKMLRSDDVGLSDHLGMRLLIHDQNNLAFPQDNGLIFQTGYSYLVSLTIVNGCCIIILFKHNFTGS